MAKLKAFFRDTNGFYLLLIAACSLLSVTLLLSWCNSVSPAPAPSFWEFLVKYRVALIQLLAVAAGLCCALIISRIDYHRMTPLWISYTAVIWLLVLLTFLRAGPFGISPGDTGAYCWIRLPFGLALQPTELAKSSFILTFSLHLYAVRHTDSPLAVGGLIAHLLAPVILIHFQGDDGTALVFFVTGLVMFLSVKHKLRYFIGTAAAALAAAPLVWHLMAGYQRARILAVFAPGRLDSLTLESILYQQNQGLAAIKAGGLFGLGLFKPDTTYIPAANNDFIFSHLAEVMGLAGCAVLILLLAAILYKTLSIGVRSHDFRGRTIAIGVFTLFLAETVINIGMNLELMPVIGLPLPFFSSGGSSLMGAFLCAGFILSVKRNSFSEKL
ncbi:rod shape determining protein RodA [Eubacterium maltosivorans]|uniref:FtsW/RodA/SpoVE family cell cycle protein n=1 Tax=Eubacterium maltosivorans TaxID=2041044 RepID=UPI000880F24F|nr:FtsW/RodA/SpoVE family cell cycle protein [Eubacterium maltosivorans]WPK80620.1 Peptidoglycan glycosyltransferase MrdB [Eubacterium maltosivorans]SDO24301.1 rod shape determining protein RodA [Eubacterium maltosivorans]